MKPPLPIIAATLGLLLGLGGGGYAYVATNRGDAPGEEEPAEKEEPARRAVIDMAPKFVVPLIYEGRVAALVVTDVGVEVEEGAEDAARAALPRLRDAFLSALYAMAVEGLFDGDLYSDNAQDRMRAGLLRAAREVMGDGVNAVLLSDLLKQDV